MSTIALITPEPQHTAELGRICFEAFCSIHDPHGFPRDFPDVETAVKVVSLISSRVKAHGVAARIDGRLVGSNFMLCTDAVAGVGPITVDPAMQGHGLGRKLMQAVLDHADNSGIDRVRLLQDSFNTASLSLYASLGFDVREPISVMRAPRITEADPTIRLAGTADWPVLDELCQRLYKVSRRNELAEWSGNGIPTLVREVGGRVRGYLLPGMLGHGVAETEADALALIAQISRHAPPGMDLFFLPLRQTVLFRAALRTGCRLIKVMTLMTRGPYEEPDPVWFPSVLY